LIPAIHIVKINIYFTAPDAPKSVAAEATDTSITFTWTEPGAYVPVPSYEVTLTGDGYEKSQTLTDSVKTATFNDLTRGRKYTFSVKSKQEGVLSEAKELIIGTSESVSYQALTFDAQSQESTQK